LADQRALRQLIDELLHLLPQLSHVVSLRYLVHAGPSQQLADLMPLDRLKQRRVGQAANGRADPP
jgi:hypothetical protein